MRSLEDSVVAFDLDGTLVDTAPDLLGALNVVLAEQGLEPLADARRLIGGGTRTLVERGFKAAGRPLQPTEEIPLTERLVEAYVARISQESAPFDGLEDALDLLAAAGARLAVCTNKREGLSRTLLDALSLSGRFRAIVGSDSVPAHKPDPGHLLHTIQAAGGRPGRAVFVGDSETDLRTARAAAVPVIGVSFGYSERPAAELGFDRLIHSYAELPLAAAELLAHG